MRALAAAVAGLGEKVGTLGTAQQRQNESQQQSTTSMDRAAAQGIQFTQRIAGVSNAIQSLVSRLGSHDTTAGLVGSIASTTAQFASMGAALGPAGAVGGAIVGFTVSLNELAQAQTTAAEHTHALTEANAQLGHQAQETTRQLAAEVVADETLYREHAEAVTSFWNVVTGNVARALSRLRDDRAQLQHDIQQEREAYEAGDAGASGLGGLSAGPSGRQFGRLPTADDVTAMTGRGATTGHAARRSGGGGDDMESAAAAARDRRAEAQRLADEEYAQHLEEQNKLLEEQQLLQQRGQEDAERSVHMREEQQRQEAEQQRRYQDQLAHFHEQQRRWDQENAAIQQRNTQQASEATSAVLGNLTNVFTTLAEGQTNAAQAAELLLAGFLQYISQRATIEALAQVAAGIGAYPDFGGMALHFAAAAAWGAVAVATGVGGAALSSDAQSKASAAQQQSQEKPASPQHEGTSGDKAATYVINWNAPVVTGQTEAQLGRTMRRMINRAEQRYPTG